MQILFHGDQSADEAADSLLSILKLFKERYGISNFREMHLDLTLMDTEGQDVELVDAGTSEVLGLFEVYKTGEYQPKARNEAPMLKLVVDNTKTR